ncbi:11862_t:CDS:2 [Entrophospora sp. SA101]|nr:11862_t:CDS:2 [Entrophospora sp. SA101]
MAVPNSFDHFSDKSTSTSTSSLLYLNDSYPSYKQQILNPTYSNRSASLPYKSINQYSTASPLIQPPLIQQQQPQQSLSSTTPTSASFSAHIPQSSSLSSSYNSSNNIHDNIDKYNNDIIMMLLTSNPNHHDNEPGNNTKNTVAIPNNNSLNKDNTDFINNNANYTSASLFHCINNNNLLQSQQQHQTNHNNIYNTKYSILFQNIYNDKTLQNMIDETSSSQNNNNNHDLHTVRNHQNNNNPQSQNEELDDHQKIIKQESVQQQKQNIPSVRSIEYQKLIQELLHSPLEQQTSESPLPLEKLSSEPHKEHQTLPDLEFDKNHKSKLNSPPSKTNSSSSSASRLNSPSSKTPQTPQTNSSLTPSSSTTSINNNTVDQSHSLLENLTLLRVFFSICNHLNTKFVLISRKKRKRMFSSLLRVPILKRTFGAFKATKESADELVAEMAIGEFIRQMPEMVAQVLKDNGLSDCLVLEENEDTSSGIVVKEQQSDSSLDDVGIIDQDDSSSGVDEKN